MKIKKEHWKETLFGKVVDHVEITETNPEIRSKSRYVSVEHIQTGKFKIENWFVEEMPTFFRSFEPGQILFGKRRAYQRKVAIADFSGICSPHIWALKSKNGLIQELLPFIMLTDKFYEYANANSAGTMSVYLKWPQLSKYPFRLPPYEEQRQIASLFQTIETAIEQVEGQEKTLRILWIRLINEFVNEKPSFGNILKGKNLRLVSFSEVTEKIMRKIDPISYGIEKIVAGENLESEDFKIRTWQKVGDGYLGPAFHVLFKPGDILYGSRRTYLKKVAMADFEGVCANTTYVIRAEENLLLQDLLKHIMLSERFTKYSIGVSKGSTNPYINWKDLDNFEFQIPDLQSQKEIAKVLDDILNLIEDFKTQKSILKIFKQNLLNELLV